MRHDIRTLTLPARADEAGDDGERFRAVADLVDRAYGRRFAGTTALTPGEQLAAWRPSSVDDHIVRVAGDREPAAASSIWLPLRESTDLLDVGLIIDPALPIQRRRALADALMDDALSIAAERGRSTIIGGSPAAATGTVIASTGFGGAEPDDPEVGALVDRGFSLEQVFRVSVADIRELDLDARLAAARERSGPDYELLAWEGATPVEHRAGMRALHERMSIDAPVGGLSLEPEEWSDERLEEFERRTTAGGRILRTAVVRHRPSGELAGFTSLFVGAALLGDGRDIARQHDTLVAGPHRGHALGMLLKLANLVELRDRHPTHPRIATWNAEENRHMLAVNEATGFVAVAHEGVWQRKDAA